MLLSPVYPSPMHDFGYDVTDHTAIDPVYGTLADFDRLVRRADELGLRVVLDFIPNHTSDRHSWFVRGRKLGDEYRDWYHWRDPAPDGGPPNNWVSAFGGPAWTWDEHSGQYYLHSFLPSMPDLNWRHPPVAAAMLDVARFWLDRGVAGLRVDCATSIGKDPLLRDNPPAEPGALAQHRPLGEYDNQRHLHDAGHPDTHRHYRELRRLLDHYPGALSLGEVHEPDHQVWAGYYGQDLDEIHLPFAFGLLEAGADLDALRRAVLETTQAIPASGWPCWVAGSHDERRLASRVGSDRARLVLLALLTLRGTPVLYYGDELGMPDADVLEILDPWGRYRPDLGRDPARAPMRWQHGPGAGFTTGGVRPWLPFSEVEPVSAQAADPASTLHLVRTLADARAAAPELRLGEQRFLDTEPGVLAYSRVLPGKAESVVVINGTAAPVVVGLPGGAEWTVVARTRESVSGISGSYATVGPVEGVLLRHRVDRMGE